MFLALEFINMLKKTTPNIFVIDFGATVVIPEYNSILVVDVALPRASFVGRIEIFRVIP